ELAARIPGASLTLLEGSSGAPFLGDSASVIRAIDRFLGLEGDAGLVESTGLGGRLVTILFTDIVGSTALTRRLGDEGARALVRELMAGKGFGFTDRGEQVLRGFEDPVHVYAVNWREGEG